MLDSRALGKFQFPGIHEGTQAWHSLRSAATKEFLAQMKTD
jgi:hypothetical protein